MRALAHAKVNLTLRVIRLRPDGYHDLASVFQSIGWSDRVEVVPAGTDGEGAGITGWDGGPVVDGTANSAWRAVEAVRAAVGDAGGVAVRLDKRIPAAAGLGGGSADAAAALALAARVLDAPTGLAASLAPTIGSDVPFCLSGGTAMVTGRGDVVSPLPPVAGFALAVVVPPIELDTPAVYRAWDALDGPRGEPMAAAAVPPALRPHQPIGNDLYPAAVALAPAVDEWRAELERRWGRPVALSGSGPALFGYFVDLEEAEAALGDLPAGARGAEAVEPATAGWELIADPPDQAG